MDSPLDDRWQISFLFDTPFPRGGNLPAKHILMYCSRHGENSGWSNSPLPWKLEITRTEKETPVEKISNEVIMGADINYFIIPDDINYDLVDNIALEAREKLKKIQPKTIGQASRISGVNPADISVLVVYVEKLMRK